MLRILPHRLRGRSCQLQERLLLLRVQQEELAQPCARHFSKLAQRR